MSEYTEQQAKADADALIARLEADPDLVEAFSADPRPVLLDAGIPTEAVDELERALGGAEVEGFAQFGGPKNLAVNTQAFTGVWHIQTIACQPQSNQCVSHGMGNDGSNCCGHF